MILDELLEFADATAIAGSTGTAVLGDVIDLEASGLHPGVGEPIYVCIEVDTEVITGGSAGTVQFFLVSDSLATLGAGVQADCTTHLTSDSLVTDDSAANSDTLNAGGRILCAALPYGAYERYLGILYTIGTTAITAGKINAYLTKEPRSWKAYPDAL